MKPRINETIKNIKKSFYRPPLPKKKQRTTMRPEPNGSIKIYRKEEIFLYQCNQFIKFINNLRGPAYGHTGVTSEEEGNYS